MFDTCPACGVGRLIPARRTYTRLYGETLVQVPNVRAWQCDACRLVIFDQDALGRIELLVGEAGPPPNVAPTRPARPSEPPAAEPSSHEDQPDDPRSSPKP